MIPEYITLHLSTALNWWLFTSLITLVVGVKVGIWVCRVKVEGKVSGGYQPVSDKLPTTPPKKR